MSCIRMALAFVLDMDKCRWTLNACSLRRVSEGYVPVTYWVESAHASANHILVKGTSFALVMIFRSTRLGDSRVVRDINLAWNGKTFYDGPCKLKYRAY